MDKASLRALMDRFGRQVPEVDRAIAEAWLGGETQGQIARRYGAAQPSISFRLRRLKERLEFVRCCHLPVLSHEDFMRDLVPPLEPATAEMLSYYYAGNSQSGVARRFGLHHQTRFRWLMRKALETLDRTGSAPEYARAIRLYWKHGLKIQTMTMRDWS
jgi:transposase-like protein